MPHKLPPGPKISEDRKILIKESMDYIERIRNAMQMILDGASETEACKTNNIDKIAFRRLIAKEKPKYASGSDLNPTKESDREILLNAFSSWQEKLFKDISQENNPSMPPDINESVDYVISNLLIKQEQDVILKIYRDNLTYIEIANELSITAERIRQIRHHVAHKLKQKHRFDIMKYGLSNYKYIEDYKTKNGKSIISKFLEDMNFEKVDGLTELSLNKLKFIRDEINGAIAEKINNNESITSEHTLNDSIELLDLTARPYNAVAHAGYHYISDFIGKTYADILSIRNMGMKAADELIEKLKNKGIIIKKEKETKELTDEILYLELPARIRNACYRNGFTYINDFAGKTVADLISINGIGPKTAREIARKLENYGMHMPEN